MVCLTTAHCSGMRLCLVSLAHRLLDILLDYLRPSGLLSAGPQPIMWILMENGMAATSVAANPSDTMETADRRSHEPRRRQSAEAIPLTASLKAAQAHRLARAGILLDTRQ